MKKSLPTKTVKTKGKNQSELDEKQPYRDLDTPWKGATKVFFREFLTLTLPKLAAVVDWTRAPEFLEQELVNLLKGRLKIKDKIHHTDRLVKLYLLTGEEQFLFLHAEHQHNPQNIFPRRMYIYRSLIALKHDTDNIVPIAVFTGAPPLSESLIYKHELYGGKISYEFNVYIIAHQSEEELLKSDNPFALIVLAALYAYRSGGDTFKRFSFLKNLRDLAKTKEFDKEIIANALTFVMDLMTKDETEEKIFYEQYEQKKSQNMQMTKKEAVRKVRQLNRIYAFLNDDGKDFIDTMEEKQKLAAKIVAEKEQIVAEKEQKIQKTILNLFFKLKLSKEAIAQSMEIPLEYVESVIDAHKVL